MRLIGRDSDGAQLIGEGVQNISPLGEKLKIYFAKLFKNSKIQNQDGFHRIVIVCRSILLMILRNSSTCSTIVLVQELSISEVTAFCHNPQLSTNWKKSLDTGPVNFTPFIKTIHPHGSAALHEMLSVRSQKPYGVCKTLLYAKLFIP